MSLKSEAKDCEIESNKYTIISEEPLSIERAPSNVSSDLRGYIKRTA